MPMADKALTDARYDVIIFKELEEGTPLYLSDDPYYATRSKSEGEADLERLANSPIKEEGGWFFSHYDEEWYNLRTSSQVVAGEEGDEHGIEATLLAISAQEAGHKVTLYHIHPQCGIDEYINDFKRHLAKPKVKQFMRERDISEQESRRLCKAQSAFMVAMPSEADLDSFAYYMNLTGTSCELDFKIISPLGVTTVFVNPWHPELRKAIDSFVDFAKRQLYLPWKGGESVLKIMDEDTGENPLGISISIMDAIAVDIDIFPDYTPGESDE